MLKKLILISGIALSALQATEEFVDLNTDEQAAQIPQQVLQEQAATETIEPTDEVSATTSEEAAAPVEVEKSLFETKKEEFKKKIEAELSQNHHFLAMRNQFKFYRTVRGLQRECFRIQNTIDQKTCSEAVLESLFEIQEEKLTNPTDALAGTLLFCNIARTFSL